MTKNAKQAISIAFPLKGEWRFLCPPGHNAFAFDFVKMDNQKKRYCSKNRLLNIISSIPSKDYYCWDQPIYSPISGRVLFVGNGWPDHEKTNIWKTIVMWYNATYRFKPEEKNGRLDIRPNAGNHVMIETKDGYIVFLAHLRNGSVQVNEGDIIKTGDLIGNVGNSGNSTAPHLHINLFDQMKDPYKAKVLPFVFDEYEELTKSGEWVKRNNDVPTIKSFIRI